MSEKKQLPKYLELPAKILDGFYWTVFYIVSAFFYIVSVLVGIVMYFVYTIPLAFNVGEGVFLKNFSNLSFSLNTMIYAVVLAIIFGWTGLVMTSYNDTEDIIKHVLLPEKKKLKEWIEEYEIFMVFAPLVVHFLIVLAGGLIGLALLFCKAFYGWMHNGAFMFGFIALFIIGFVVNIVLRKKYDFDKE